MSTRKLKVMTAVGGDRPGLVKAISSMIHAAGGNVEDSRMAILGGEFALVLLVAGDDAQLLKVQAGAETVASELGLNIFLKETDPPASKTYLSYRIRVSGFDHPGIVEHVSDVLASRAVNVESLDTRIAHQPLTGTPVFVLEGALQVPPEANLSELRAALGRLCDEEHLDYQLEARV